MPASDDSDAVQVGDWVVNPSLDTISRGDECQKLEPRTMRLLLCLVASAGNVVSVDHLLREVWAGVIVGPASVYQAVSQLRKLLHDVDPEPTYIATVPRKGYRLIAAVRPVARVIARAEVPVCSLAAPMPPVTSPVASRNTPPVTSPVALRSTPPVAPPVAPCNTPPGAPPVAPCSTPPVAPPVVLRKHIKLAAAVGAASVISILCTVVWLRSRVPADVPPASIVVLPFVDLTAEKTGQPFCDGLTEELSNWLSQIPTLRVVARTSAFALRGAEGDVRKIGRDLDTNHILEGSMRRSGDHTRVTVQLIDARNGYHLWSAEYDKPMDDTIAMQEDISRSVARNLQIRLTADTSRRFAARRSQDPAAYQMYLAAQYYRQQRTRESNERAIELYLRVVEADPEFAPAYVGLSYSRLNQQWLENRPIGEIAAEIEPLIAAALRLEPNVGEGFAVRAALRADQDRVPEALHDLRLAISLDPNDSMAFAEMGRLWLHDGRPRDALSNFERAVALDPLDFRRHAQLCSAFEDLARYAEARAACMRAHELQPDNAEAANGLASLAFSHGAIGDALRWNAESIRLAPDEFDYYWTRAELLWTVGLAERARAVLERGRDGSRDNEMVDAVLGSVIYMERGAEGLRAHMKAAHLDESMRSAVLLQAAYLHLMLDEPAAVDSLIKRALAAPDHQPELTAAPWQARFGDSEELKLSVAELESGDHAAATARLTALAAMLDRMIEAGVERPSTYELRAEVRAVRGHADEAMQDLVKASSLGWRRAWWAEHEPYFAALRSRGDFRLLMAKVGQSNARLIENLDIKPDAGTLSRASSLGMAAELPSRRFANQLAP